MPRYATKRVSPKYWKTKQKAKAKYKAKYKAKARRKYGGMTKKRVLQITSTKKKDTMLCYSNTTAASPQGGTTYAASDAVLTGGNFYVFPWIASARPGTLSGGSAANPIMEADRTATTCFMRGLKERIEIQTNSALSWQWRRICFTMKGSRINQNDANNLRFSLQTSVGMVRVVNNINTAKSFSDFKDLIFRGSEGTDWNNMTTAPVDTKRVTLKYDRTRTIATGNQSGIMRKYEFWHPMNKNLVFDDDEFGDNEVLNRYSTVSKAGMGDFYVIDIITPGLGGTNSDLMNFGPSATLYWSEK